MKGPPIDQLVYAQMFPKPKSTDPQSFQLLLARQLVPEVRHETQAFYGHLSSQEAKYPGLDYSYQPHRNRLSRYPWHRRLFRAFDALQLTASEIAGLTKWEGTRWAKERFESEHDIVIRDTTGDGIEDWVEPELRVSGAQEPQVEAGGDREMEDNKNEGQGEEDEDMEDEDEDSDVEIRSVGIELNERLRAAVARREAGHAATVMDEEWEQWLKDAVEAGGIPMLPADLSANANTQASQSPTMHPRLLNAARLGQWQQIPDFLQSMVRQNIEASIRRMEDLDTASASSPRLSSNLSPRLSAGTAGAGARAAPSSSAAATTTQIGPREVARHDYRFSRILPPLPPGALPRGPLGDATS